ncbi:MAG: UvrD-helicase domain-containing protein [Syntrophobacteraceae bacterium]
MKQFREIIELEKTRLGQIVGEMRETLASEELDRQNKDRELAELKRQKLDAVGWREKREIDEVIERCRARYAMRHYQDGQVLSHPYFGILELEDDELGKLSYCLGRQSFFDSHGKARVIDWREAPISRLYYEYEAGELYDEEIRGRDRSGLVRSKRQVETAGGELQKIIEKGILLIRQDGASWQIAGEGGSAVSRKEEKADHRLPKITALISSDQFRAITHPGSSTVLLQGGAGSGKTTVGLHRIAYLTYQDAGHFQPDRILVVMFNRSLQHYISRVLPELGIGPGVQVETYHGWAGKLFRAAGLHISYSSDPVPAGVMRLKKHPLVLDLVDRYLDGLLRKSRKWFLEQLARNADPELDRVRAHLENITRFEDFLKLLGSPPDFLQDIRHEPRKALRSRLLGRFNDHAADLQALLSDRALMEETCRAENGLVKDGLDQLIERQQNLRNQNRIDFADTGILLCLLQRKGIAGARPGYAHLMVDEAQDLSEIELATLLYAADERQSVTICGDMAQKIKGDVYFDTSEGFAGFVRTQQQRIGAKGLCSDTLEVGFRATRPIMELAWNVLGKEPSMSVPRDGEPVQIIRSKSPEETLSEAKAILEVYMGKRPKALIAVICRYKADADRVFEQLKLRGLSNMRRHERDDFSFQPGIVVTNAHQVKGLEFSAVLIINPAAAQYRDDHENRMLLHVAITRAADHLWIVGHQPMAYGLDEDSAPLLEGV